MIDFKTIICDEYFISYLDRFIHVRQIRKRDHNILKNQSNKDFINHSYIKERRNTLDCLRIITLFQYQNPREFIYFFSSVLLFTINFRLCFFEPQMERYIKNFKIKTDCNIYEYGFGHRSFVYSDLASTKKILARNVFTKENYTFDDFINYIFNCYENTEESKLEKKEMFIRLFRLTYIEVYSYFKDYILQKNI
ncbi:hypothetical protein H312_00586 [Anncaliia algerae PRA339]|uniref:Uncharacterized protein n=1 Tax=Anncaliia algerae PRA339 TaxID=1288291 RepID=A0A059F3T5_9MICR|nr:hypothetical protein H312_00586 [Anncaliia algerae PRA339]